MTNLLWSGLKLYGCLLLTMQAVMGSLPDELFNVSMRLNIQYRQFRSKRRQYENITSNLFYIYELPDIYHMRWPDTREGKCHHLDFDDKHSANSGFGEVIDRTTGRFSTHQYSLFSNLYARLRHSNRRTLNPDDAGLYIIPYDITMDGYTQGNCSIDSQRECTHELAVNLLWFLSDSLYFRRHGGADHLLVWSMGQYSPYPLRGCDALMIQTCKLCSITSLWMDPWEKGSSSTLPPGAVSHFVSVPLPSTYHYIEGLSRPPWYVIS